MTQDNWRPIAALIDNLWKDEFDEGREAAYLAALGHYDPREVQAAVLALAGRPGGAWAPSASEISTEIHAQRYIGTWGWASEVIRELVGAHMDDDREFLMALCNRRQPGFPAALREAIASVHTVYGPLACQLVDELGLVALRNSAGNRFAERKHQRAWAAIIAGTVDPVALLAEASVPTAIRPVH